MADQTDTPTPDEQPNQDVSRYATEPHPAIGVTDGAVENGERMVYEYDNNGQVSGWHKEPLSLAEKVAAGEQEKEDQGKKNG